MSRRLLVCVAGIAAMAFAGAPNASAQVFGTFSWQMQPYCNVATLTLASTPVGFTLDGVDDQCGSTNKASAVGVASFNGAGTVTLSFTVILAPSAKPVHVAAIVSPANGNGTWSDSVGNNGTFALFAAVPGLPPRPLPASGLAAAVVTAVELAANAVTGAKVADGSLTATDLLNGPRAAFAGGTQQQFLFPTPAVVRTVIVSAPSSGKVIASASGYVNFPGTASASALCTIASNTTFDGHQVVSQTDESSSEPFALTRGFNVAAGPFTVNLVCSGPTGVTAVRNTSLTAIFVAQ